MRRLLLGPLCVVILSVVAASLGADVKITYLSGPVLAYRNGTWGEATRGMVLSSNDKIKTNANSRATITINEHSKIWITPGTELAVGEVDKGNTFKLFVGRIRAKCKFLAGRKFQVATPISVCSVRGTFWNQLATRSGGTSILVGNGTVSCASTNLLPASVGPSGPSGQLEGTPIHRGSQLTVQPGDTTFVPQSQEAQATALVQQVQQEQQQGQGQGQQTQHTEIHHLQGGGQGQGQGQGQGPDQASQVLGQGLQSRTVQGQGLSLDQVPGQGQGQQGSGSGNTTLTNDPLINLYRQSGQLGGGASQQSSPGQQLITPEQQARLDQLQRPQGQQVPGSGAGLPGPQDNTVSMLAQNNPQTLGLAPGEVVIGAGQQLIWGDQEGFVPTAGNVVFASAADLQALEQEQLRDEQQEAAAEQQQQQQQQQQQEKKDEKKDQTLDLRNELRQIVSDVQNNLTAQRELTNEIKDSDFSAGRTLRDVHGNVVRVEQHLLRPDDQTLQLLNLTKRSDYVYSDRQGWGFTVPNTSRLDVMDVKIKMNMSLPDDISRWPSYISSKGDSIHPESVDVSLTNQTDTLLSHGDWRLKGQLDEKGKTLSDDQLVFNSYINGWKVDPNYDSPDDGINYPEEDHDPTDLYMWSISPTMHLTKAGEADKYVKLYTEGYALNNDGGILKLSDFTSTHDDPFTVLKQVAGEQIVFCRETDAAKTSFFTRGNLDLVYTPDLAIVVGEKLVTQVGDLTRSSSDEETNGNAPLKK